MSSLYGRIRRYVFVFGAHKGVANACAETDRPTDCYYVVRLLLVPASIPEKLSMFLCQRFVWKMFPRRPTDATSIFNRNYCLAILTAKSTETGERCYRFIKGTFHGNDVSLYEVLRKLSHPALRIKSPTFSCIGIYPPTRMR